MKILAWGMEQRAVKLELRGISQVQRRGIPADGEAREEREEMGSSVQDTPLGSDFSSTEKTEP